MTVNASGAQTRLTEQVAEEIRALLARRRISGRELARRLGASHSWVNFRLTGAQPINLDDLQRIAEVLEVEVADLLPRTDSGRLVTTAGHHERSQARINDRKATVTGRTRPTGGPANPIPRQETRRPARIPLALTGS